MKHLLKPVLAAGLFLFAAGPLASSPAFAQVVKGIGVVDLPAVVANSKAFKVAEQQRPVTYKSTYDQAKARNEQINQQIKPLVDKFQADQQAPNADQAALKQQYDTIQQIDQQAQRELTQIMVPVIFSQDYVEEQINGIIPQALENAAKKKGVSLIFRLNPNSLLYRDAATYDMNDAVTAELDALLPIAQLVPPQGWLPRDLREKQAQQQAAQQQLSGAAPQPETPAGPPVQGR
jgi:Skp family chaperone for outer membrane proteins